MSSYENAEGVSISTAAEILDFKMFDENVRIKYIILNNVSSEKLYLILKKEVEKYTDIDYSEICSDNETDRRDVTDITHGLKMFFQG